MAPSKIWTIDGIAGIHPGAETGVGPSSGQSDFSISGDFMFSRACLPVSLLRLRAVAVLAFLVAALLGASSLAAVSPATATVPPAAPGCTISDTLVNSCRPWLGAESGDYGVTGLRA